MRFLAALLFVVVIQSGWAADKPKNIIMVVGDGMGPAYTTAYRYFKDNRQSSIVSPTVFDRNLVGMASTYPARQSGYVTDSAAGATALSSGIKTYNGAIAVDVDKQNTPTVLEFAKKKGMKTGIAVTSQINHATPASFAAHNEYRRNYNEIADSYFDDKVNGQFILDVMLGGGWEYFIRDKRNLVEEFKQAGYQYIDNLDGLKSLTANKPLLGLFGESGMPWALDTPNNTRLPLLTKAAVSQLENTEGFFLLVEASQVDWAGHGNDIAGAMAEMHDMALTLEWLEQYVANHPDTLVVVTADHSTGGLSIAANKDYRWEPDWIKNLQASPQKIGEQLANSADPLPLAQNLLGFSLNPQEKKSLQAQEESDADDWIKKVKSIIDRRTNTGWTTSGHTAVDVQIFAMGHSKSLFHGHMDNTQIPKIIFSLLDEK